MHVLALTLCVRRRGMHVAPWRVHDRALGRREMNGGYLQLRTRSEDVSIALVRAELWLRLSEIDVTILCVRRRGMHVALWRVHDARTQIHVTCMSI